VKNHCAYVKETFTSAAGTALRMKPEEQGAGRVWQNQRRVQKLLLKAILRESVHHESHLLYEIPENSNSCSLQLCVNSFPQYFPAFLNKRQLTSCYGKNLRYVMNTVLRTKIFKALILLQTL